MSTVVVYMSTVVVYVYGSCVYDSWVYVSKTGGGGHVLSVLLPGSAFAVIYKLILSIKHKVIHYNTKERPALMITSST